MLHQTHCFALTIIVNRVKYKRTATTMQILNTQKQLKVYLHIPLLGSGGDQWLHQPFLDGQSQ